MGTESYSKAGNISRTAHATKGKRRPGGEEHYKNSMHERCPPLAGGPESFERKYDNDYRKVALPSQTAEE